MYKCMTKPNNYLIPIISFIHRSQSTDQPTNPKTVWIIYPTMNLGLYVYFLTQKVKVMALTDQV